MTNKRILVRANKDMIDDLRIHFPKMNTADILQIMHDTSLLRFESKLQNGDFKNKMGTFIYGKNMWKKTEKK